MKLPLLSGRQIVAALQRLGFVEMQHPDGRRLVFPFHDEVDRYTLKGASRDGGVEAEDFLRALK